MDYLPRGESGDALAYEFKPPPGPDGACFVFFNALTGAAEGWRAGVLPPLIEAGHGYLLFDYRGQGESRFSPDTPLAPALIESDAGALMDELAPQNAILVGLSIGGLFAARCRTRGAGASGLVLINTLRADGPRLRWVNDAVRRAVEVGGLELFRDLYSPLLFNEDWQRENRPSMLREDPDYRPIDRSSGTYNLLAHAGEADWNLDYEAIDMPVLVITGLQDRVFYNEADVAALAARMPDARRLDMGDAGHLIPAERPNALALALQDFARDLMQS